MNANMMSLLSVIEKLRSPEGCPWDLEQDLLSMRPYLLEETFEMLEALDLALPNQEDANHNQLLCEELGDLLFVVLLLASNSRRSRTIFQNKIALKELPTR